MNKQYVKKLIDKDKIVLPKKVVNQLKWEKQLLKLTYSSDNTIIVEETNENDFISPFVKRLSYHSTGYRLLIPQRFLKALKWKTLKLTVNEEAKRIIISKGMKRKGVEKYEQNKSARN
jgi:hypothetical protein